MIKVDQSKKQLRKPHWLTKSIPSGGFYSTVKHFLMNGQINTVCKEACCPNMWECFSMGTIAFLISGNRCTRNCRFCAISYKPLEPPDISEPSMVAEAVLKLGLQYAVITSVTRDDLSDGGAKHFFNTIQEIRRKSPSTLVEILIPDFQGSVDALMTITKARPDVLNHNLETVPRLYPIFRAGADYRRSLELLKQVWYLDPTIPTKSGLMLGIGETSEEIRSVLADLLAVNCKTLTLGQYLQPSMAHLPVNRYVPPKEFEYWRTTALKMGFYEVASGPFVRSSYHADKLYRALKSPKKSES